MYKKKLFMINPLYCVWKKQLISLCNWKKQLIWEITIKETDVSPISLDVPRRYWDPVTDVPKAAVNPSVEPPDAIVPAPFSPTGKINGRNLTFCIRQFIMCSDLLYLPASALPFSGNKSHRCPDPVQLTGLLSWRSSSGRHSDCRIARSFQSTGWAKTAVSHLPDGTRSIFQMSVKLIQDVKKVLFVYLFLLLYLLWFTTHSYWWWRH